MIDQERIRVLLADDHPLVLEGIRACLEAFAHIDVVATAANGKDALALARELQPNIVVLDINMPELNGLDATELFKEEMPEIKLLVLSMHDNKEYVSTALLHGARGYVLKDVSTREIVNAIVAIHHGGTYFSAGVSDLLMDLQSDPARGNALTTREQTILLLLADGRSNKEVARELDISVRTVETHRKNLKRATSSSTTDVPALLHALRQSTLDDIACQASGGADAKFAL
ncbi:MAG: response regulator transcription factor, partial [Pseudomonadota bacterium]